MLFDLWDGLSLFKKIYDQSLEPVCKKYQLTRMELDILLFLANNPGYDTAKDIIERRRLTKSHVSMSLKDFREAGSGAKGIYPGNQKTAHLKLSRHPSRWWQKAAGPEEVFPDGFPGF